MVPAVIPAYAAEKTIADVVMGVRAAGVERVFVVDDGSRDATSHLAESAGATVLRHARNRGKGAALWTGFHAARRAGAAQVVTLDADGQHDPAEIPRLVAAAQEQPTALVIGARDRGGMPRRSRVGNQVSTWFLSRFTGERLTDSQSGFRVYPTALLERLSPRARRFDAETELLLAAVTHGHPVIEVAIRTIYRDGGATHFRDVLDTTRIVTLVLGWLAHGRRSSYWP